MKKLNTHLVDLLKRLNVDRLVNPVIKNKIRALREECRHGRKLTRILGNMFERGEQAANQLEYLNNTIPELNLGEQLLETSFSALRDYNISIEDLARIVGYAHHRVTSHTKDDVYNAACKEEDAKLVGLPEEIAKLTQDNKENIRYFLVYMQECATDTPLEELPQKYKEFEEIVLTHILPAGKYAQLLELKESGSWAEVKYIHKDDEDAELILVWADRFQDLEKQYSYLDLPKLAKALSPYL